MMPKPTAGSVGGSSVTGGRPNSPGQKNNESPRVIQPPTNPQYLANVRKKIKERMEYLNLDAETRKLSLVPNEQAVPQCQAHFSFKCENCSVCTNQAKKLLLKGPYKAMRKSRKDQATFS